MNTLLIVLTALAIPICGAGLIYMAVKELVRMSDDNDETVERALNDDFDERLSRSLQQSYDRAFFDLINAEYTKSEVPDERE